MSEHLVLVAEEPIDTLGRSVKTCLLRVIQCYEWDQYTDGFRNELNGNTINWKMVTSSRAAV